MGNFENKLIYYVVRPFLNKHYDSQVRARRIVSCFRDLLKGGNK